MGINKPVAAPEATEWEDTVETCEHGFPVLLQPWNNCLICAEVWRNLTLWGELLDEA